MIQRRLTIRMETNEPSVDDISDDEPIDKPTGAAPSHVVKDEDSVFNPYVY